MQYSKHNFVTPDIILADVLKAVDDEEYRFNSKGWYTSQIQQALQELSFDTFFDERTIELEIKGRANLELPAGTFNVIEMYLFNGDLCNISSPQNVWHKRNFFTKGSGALAKNLSHNNKDPFYTGNFFRGDNQTGANENTVDTRRFVTNENNYYYNIDRGVIMLSVPCMAFEKLAIKINGTGCDIGDLPIVPQFFRETVKDFVCEVALRNMMVKDTSLKAIWQVYDRNLNKNENYGQFNGSWYKAKYRIANMSSHERESLREYLSKAAW